MHLSFKLLFKLHVGSRAVRACVPTRVGTIAVSKQPLGRGGVECATHGKRHCAVRLRGRCMPPAQKTFTRTRTRVLTESNAHTLARACPCTRRMCTRAGGQSSSTLSRRAGHRQPAQRSDSAMGFVGGRWLTSKNVGQRFGSCSFRCQIEMVFANSYAGNAHTQTKKGNYINVKWREHEGQVNIYLVPLGGNLAPLSLFVY